jgi:hypothetical protein
MVRRGPTDEFDGAEHGSSLGDVGKPSLAGPKRRGRISGRLYGFQRKFPPRSVLEPIGTEQVYRSNVKFIGGNPMAKDDHNKAAEHHDNAAKSHRAAAEQHGKGDHAKGREHSATAQQHSQSAGKQSEQAHSKSQQQK